MSNKTTKMIPIKFYVIKSVRIYGGIVFIGISVKWDPGPGTLSGTQDPGPLGGPRTRDLKKIFYRPDFFFVFLFCLVLVGFLFF